VGKQLTAKPLIDGSFAKNDFDFQIGVLESRILIKIKC
jgi:hypothetical protein